MVYQDNNLWRVSIPHPNVDGNGTVSVLVYKWKSYGDKTGKELVKRYGGERILKVEKKLDDTMWKWLKESQSI